MSNNEINIQADIEKIARIDAVSNILDVVCLTTGMGFAAVARVTDTKWVACAVRDDIQFGLAPGGELKLETTICNEIRESQKVVVIDHVAKDPLFATHHTPAMYGFQSYISIPITLKTGEFFGTLCAIDPRPNELNNTKTLGMFQLFADLIAFHIHSAEQLALSESNLHEERQTAELREQFISILGHDLGNPLGAVSSSAQVLQRMPLTPDAANFVRIIKNASFRMKGLIDNILDFARGRMGDGITLQSKTCDLQPILTQVIEELHVMWPDRTIETEFELREPFNCDGRRIAQLFSNLLNNALTHGQKDTPIKINADTHKGVFTLSVTNAGQPIPEAAMARLFNPFSRGEVKPGQQGLGLGLYIASEIARAHNGSLNVVSTEEETKFTLRLG
ncbi:GAF domain-containing sensor histidine kinase [Mucilaginibacter gynuensis]|uniref:GAF domain-containing sensor histidine kinase n=1 Tax=Mucilaginibacter gynuensis TaxID=1302236 RepID=UPI0031F13C84